MMGQTEKINQRIASIIFLMTVALSLLSQLPVVLDSGLDAVLKLVWVLPFGFFLLTSPQLFLDNKMQPFYAFLFAIIIFCVICQTATGDDYFSQDVSNIAISLLVTLVSFMFWRQYGDDDIMHYMSIVVVVCGMLLALQIYFDFLRGSDIMSATYAYSAKNSAGQILLCCAFVILMFYKSNTKALTLACRFAAIVMLIIMFIMKARATIVSAFIMGIYFAFIYGSKKVKIAVVGISLLSLAAIFMIPSLYQTIVQGILMGGRDATDANELSSGRVVLFAIAFQRIPQSPWIGSGNYYVDCMPLNILTEWGIIGLSIILLFLFYIFNTLRKKQRVNKIYTSAFVLYLAFLANAMFEAYPPFGPGMKCFFMWMFFGFALAEKGKEKVYE